MQYLIIIYSFMTALLIGYILIVFLAQSRNSVKRLNKYLDSELYTLQEPKHKFNLWNWKESLRSLLYSVKDVGNLSVFSRYKKSIQAELIKAHIPLKGEEFITLSLIITAGLAVLAVLSARNAAAALPAGILGWFAPIFFVRAKIKRRIKLLNDQLGDTLSLISNSLKSGYSFFQAVDTITTEMSGSIAEEFAQLKKEINLGLTTENALENLVKRVGSDDLELVVTAIMIQRQVGGNLAEILDNISDTIRHRIRIKGEIKTMTAQGRMSGIIIGVIPPVIGVVIGTINPQYIGLLFTTQMGWIMVGVSIVMELIGIIFIRSIIKIEV